MGMKKVKMQSIISLVLVFVAITGFIGMAHAQAPTRGGVFTMPLFGNPTMWPMVGGVNNVLANKTLYSCLIKYDPVDLHPTGDLAESWSVSDDGLVWTFKLKKNVKWHDGHSFTAHDVKFSFDLFINPKVTFLRKATFKDVMKNEVVDDYTFRLYMKKPFASFATILGYLINILPKHKLENLSPKELLNPEEFLRHPIGTGPFKFKEFVPGSHLKVVANKDYYDGAPYIDAVIYKIIRDIDAQIAQLQTGQLDMIILEPHQVPAVEKNPNIYISLAKQVNYQYISINNRNPLFRDKRVRQALTYGIDKEAILKNVYKGMGEICTGPINPILSWVYNPKVKRYPYDPEKAKALLKEAGWTPGTGGVLHNKEGKPFHVTLLVDKGNPVREQLAVVAQEYWRKIGIDVRIKGMEFIQVLRAFRKLPPDYEMLVMWYITPPDPDILDFYHTGSPMNNYAYSNPEADKLLEEGRQTFDRQKRIEIYKKLQEIIAEDPPVVYLYYPKEIRALSKRVKNYAGVGYRDATIYLYKTWLAK